MTCTDSEHILEIEDLSISFIRYEKGLKQTELNIIKNLSVSVHVGEIVAIIGASGSGKSLLAHSVLGILPPNCKASANIYFEGERLTPERIEELRGNKIAFVPQNVTFLDPLEQVGAQVRIERKDKKTLKRQADLFELFDLPPQVARQYPFELSGGMARRILLSAALIDNPRLIIADEPTPGLHLEAAKKALEYFRRFADQGNGVLLITHDIDLALDVADRIAVFYAGSTIEEALTSDFDDVNLLRHPYSKALWHALPQNGFRPFPGIQPFQQNLPSGCAFQEHCPLCSSDCSNEIPLRVLRCGTVRCIHAV